MRAGGFGPLGGSGLGDTRTRFAGLWRSDPACGCLEGRERAGSGGDGLKSNSAQIPPVLVAPERAVLVRVAKLPPRGWTEDALALGYPAIPLQGLRSWVAFPSRILWHLGVGGSSG